MNEKTGLEMYGEIELDSTKKRRIGEAQNESAEKETLDQRR